MPENGFEARLRRALERPGLTAPTPVQARYRQARAIGARRSRSAWFRVGAAFAAGAIAAVILLSTSTGSANPKVWQMKVVSTLVDLRPEPVATPTAVPTVAPSQEQRGGTPPTNAGGNAQKGSPEPSEKPDKESPEPKRSSSPSPGSDDHSGSGGDGSEAHGGASPTPTASPHPQD